MTLLACSDFGTFRHASVIEADAPLRAGSCSAETQLLYREPPPAEAVGGMVGDDVAVVHYPGPSGDLKGWLMRPEGVQNAPVLVFFHSGFAWSPAHAEALRPWVERGWAVFMPALRGENGNPGMYELLCGEIDDAAAAVTWIATHPGIDPTRIATFGHSLGGGTSALLALRDELPIAASGSVGGLYFEELLEGWGPMLPFDPRDPKERRRRLLVAHLGELKRPHTAYMGQDDALRAVVEPARKRAAELGAPLEVVEVAGDHQRSLAPALEAYWNTAAIQVMKAQEPESP